MFRLDLLNPWFTQYIRNIIVWSMWSGKKWANASQQFCHTQPGGVALVMSWMTAWFHIIHIIIHIFHNFNWGILRNIVTVMAVEHFEQSLLQLSRMSENQWADECLEQICFLKSRHIRGWNFSTLRVLHWSGEEQSLQAVSAAEQEESHARMRAEAQAEGGNMKSMNFWGLCED